VRAGAAQSDAGAAQSDGTDGGGSQAGTAVATDVEIAAGESGDEAGPAALPFTGFQLLLLAMLGLGAIAGGAALRRAS
jgi:hypothetical protein